jgi:O-antigen ligase/tetratricopeptide (TPR) repeat protein
MAAPGRERFGRHCDALVHGVVVLLLIFSPFAFGAVHAWSLAIVELLSAALVAAWAAKLWVCGSTMEANRRVRRWSLPLLCFGALAVLQLLPLPPSLLRLISPHTYALYRENLPGWPDGAPFGELSRTLAELRASTARPSQLGPLPSVSARGIPAASAIAPEVEQVTALAQQIRRSGRWRSVSVYRYRSGEELLRMLALGAVFLFLVGYPWERPTNEDPAARFGSSTTSEEPSADGFPRRLRAWLAAVVAVGVIESLYGAYQVIGQHPQIYWLRKTAYLDSATGTFVNRNHLAGYLELVIPMAIALLLAELRWWRRPRRTHGRHTSGQPGSRSLINAALLGAVALMFIAIGLTQSRGGVLSCLGGLGFGALVLGAWRHQLTAPRMALGGVVLGALALVWLQSPQLLRRFGGDLRLTPYSRPSIWRETLVMARDFPLLGVGLGDFEFVFPHYQPAGTTTYFDQAHNDYLQLLVETGVLGAACFAWLFVSFFLLVRRRLWTAAPERALLAIGLATGVAALLLHSLTDFNLHIPSNALLFVVALAALVRLLDRGGGSAALQSLPVGSRAPLIAMVAAVCLVSVTVVRNWRVESLVRSIFPNTSLVSRVAPAPAPLPVRMRRVDTALRFAEGQAELAAAVGTFAQQLADQGMRDRLYMIDPQWREQTATAWAAAAQAFERMLERQPSSAVAHLRLGQAVLGLVEVRHGFQLPAGVIHQVADLFDRTMWLQPRSRDFTRAVSGWALLHWGLLSHVDRARATSWTRQALALDPLRGRELLRLAILWDPALPFRFLPDKPEVRLYLAMAYQDAGRPEDAARVSAELDKQLSAAVQRTAARFDDAELLARVREFRHDASGAAEAYSRAAELAPNDSRRAEMLKRSGYNWLTAGDATRAEHVLVAARRYGVRDAEALAGLSAVYEQRGDFATAARWMKDAVAVAPGKPDYRYRLAQLFERGHEYGKANEQYRRLLRRKESEFLASHQTDILLGLARNYRQLELGAEARRYYRLVLQHDPQNREALQFLSYFGS